MESNIIGEIVTMASEIERVKNQPDGKQIFGNFIHENEVTLLAGKTNVGKSILAFQIAYAVSSGKSALDETNELAASKVLYYDFENKDHQFKNRYSELECNDNFLKVGLKQLLLNDSDLNIDTIKRHILSDAPDVIIIDNMGFLTETATTDQTVSLKLIKDLQRICSEFKITIIVVVHTKKIIEPRPFSIYDIEGSAKLVNYCDSVLAICKSKQDSDFRYIKHLKGRNSDIGNDVKVVKFSDVGYLHFDHVGYDSERNHVDTDLDRYDTQKTKLIDLAEKIFENGGLRYVDFLHRYSEIEGKSKENGKKVHAKMKGYNIIILNPDKYWIINRNEVPE